MMCIYDCEIMVILIVFFFLCIDIGNKYFVYVMNRKGNFMIKIIYYSNIIVCKLSYFKVYWFFKLILNFMYWVKFVFF